MQNETPIFKSTYQAVQVSYLVALVIPSQKSILQSLYEQFGDRKGEEPIVLSGINFGKLSPMDQRAECANVRRIVETKLHGIERCIILAKFSRGLKQDRYIRRVQLHLTGLIHGIAKTAVNDIVDYLYHEKNKISSRRISKRSGLSHHTINYALKKVTKITRGAEISALGRLSKIFVAGGIAEE